MFWSLPCRSIFQTPAPVSMKKTWPCVSMAIPARPVRASCRGVKCSHKEDAYGESADHFHRRFLHVESRPSRGRKLLRMRWAEPGSPHEPDSRPENQFHGK